MEKEIWKDIEGAEDNYQVSNLGRVRRVMIIAQHSIGNYVAVDVGKRKDGTINTQQVRRLVAHHFIKKLNNSSVVIHKDNNPRNNAVENLRVCDPHRCELSPDLPNEKWKPVPTFEGRYEISNMGRIRSLTRMIEGKKMKPHLRYGKLLTVQHKEKYSQFVIHDKINKKYKAMTLHTLVAQLFVPNPRHLKLVRFKDGNTKNIRADNLEYYLPDGYQHPDTIERIRKDYRKGIPIKEIAAKYNLPAKKVYKYCKCVGRPPKYNASNPTKFQIDRRIVNRNKSDIVREYQNGKSVATLAKQYGVEMRHIRWTVNK